MVPLHARRGVGTYELLIEGKAHSGIAPEVGISAYS